MERVRPKRPDGLATPTQCKYCGHPYLSPCDELRQKTCLNVKLKDRKRAVVKPEPKRRKTK